MLVALPSEQADYIGPIPNSWRELFWCESCERRRAHQQAKFHDGQWFTLCDTCAELVEVDQ